MLFWWRTIPFDYASFEGIIPKGHYGAGVVVIWDMGEYELLGGSATTGKFEFILHGKKLKGTFVLTKMRGKEKEWLLIKKSDQFSDREFKIKPILSLAVLKNLKDKITPCETS